MPEDENKSPLPPSVDYFRREWKTAKNAPVFFLVTLCIGTTAAYWFIDHSYTAELRAKDAEIALLSRRPESVPAQQAEIVSLKAEIQDLKGQWATEHPAEWAPLTEAQIQSWVTSLTPTHISTIRVFWGQEVDARKFYMSLREVGKRIKCEVVAGGGNASRNEFEVIARRDEPAGAIIASLLRNLDYPVNLQNETAEKGMVLIFIGEKPERGNATK